MNRLGRFRRLFGRSGELSRGLVSLGIGVLAFTVGSALSFKNLILPFYSWLFRWMRTGVEHYAGPIQAATLLHLVGGVLLLLGVFAVWRGGRLLMTHVLETLDPSLGQGGKIDAYLRRRALAQGPRVVAIGGGTGLSTLLKGIKHHTSNITAVVTVTDDGGSSGRLMRDKHMIPPGDIRNCLVALADAEKAMADLFQHRFKDDSGALSGHSVGNLLIAALVDQSKGDFERAVEVASKVLKIRGHVVPSTLDHVGLSAIFDDETEVHGETALVSVGRKIRRIALDPPNARAHPDAIEAIRDAELIVMGPGSVYTSILPNLLVPGIAEAIAASPAKKVYVCNVMTQKGESEGMTASEHARVLQEQVGRRVFDYVMMNVAVPSEAALARYEVAGQKLVEADADRVRALGYRILPGNYVDETDVVRHDPTKLAARLMAVVEG